MMLAIQVRRWLRPREGWGTFSLALATTVCLPAAVVAADWVPRDEGLLLVAVCALLVGRWLAARPSFGWSVWLPVSVCLGFLAALSVAAHAMLFVPSGARATLGFYDRWLLWLQAAFGGGRSQDPDIFLFYASALCWLIVLFAAWAFYRRRRPLLGLALPALVSAVSVFYSEQGVVWVVAQMGCGVLLAALGGLQNAQHNWEAEDVDYAVDLQAGVGTAAALVAILVSLLSYFGPLLSPQKVSDWFRRTFQEPTEQVEDTAERLFAGVSTPRGGLPRADEEGGGASSYLPQDRLLGGRPDLLDDVVMMVWTDEPPPPPEELAPLYAVAVERPPHYWQGLVFDRYTGRGWSATVNERRSAQGDLPATIVSAYRDVTQHFELKAPHGDTLYSLSNPIYVEETVEALWRTAPISDTRGASVTDEHAAGTDGGATPDANVVVADLAGLASETMSYTVVSRLLEPTATALRQVPENLPTEIQQYYLQLPDTVPQRVIELAGKVVTEGGTVYEKARLLETYLRQYPYSLDVDTPPAGRDVADYFLFDAREGYCDYYATAFVVMARAVGIPARLVSGYVGGGYDDASGAYLVRQYNGHSWPEVYFPGWGWIGFEPTGSQPVRQLREEVSLTGSRALPRPAGLPARVIRLRWRLVGLALAGLAIVVGLILWIRPRLQQRRRTVTLPLVWYWVGLAGSRAGVRQDAALTPYEYANLLATELRARAAQTKWFHDEWAALAQRATIVLGRLALLYSEQTYGGGPTRFVKESALRAVWAQTRSTLWRFRWLALAQHLTGGSRREAGGASQ